MADLSSSLDTSIQQPLQPSSDPEFSSSSLVTLLRAEHQQDSSGQTQLPPLLITSPGKAHPSLGPCSPTIVVDDPPSSAADGDAGEGQVAGPPTRDLAADLTQSVHLPPPSLPTSSPIIHHPPSPSESTIAPAQLPTTDPSTSAAVTPVSAERQSPLSSTPKAYPTTNHGAAATATISTTTTAIATAITDLPLSNAAPNAAPVLLEKDLLPTPPVSDCSPPQLDTIVCKIKSETLPPPSPPPPTDLPHVNHSTLPPHQTTTVPSYVDGVPPSPQQPPIASSPSQPPSVEPPQVLPPSVISGQSSPPPPPPINASVNSLSPLSDVPSIHSPNHVIESPLPRSHSIPPPSQPSPVPAKRHASPTMHEPGVLSDLRTDGSPSRPNGNGPHTNGQGAHKRPRLANDSSSSAPINSTLSNPPFNSSTTHFHQQQVLHSHSLIASSPSQPMVEPVGLVPGHPGTRLTKDQHRFAISVTKQLKKHRSSQPFLVPVDPVALNIPDYFNVVTHPMDLSTIETRLGKVGKPCYYKSVQDFVSDIQQVFSNCYMYNGPPHASHFSRAAADLSIQFESQMKKMPPDEPSPYAVPSRSPSLVKPQPKVKPSVEPRISPPAAKRKNISPTANAFPLPVAHATSQKRRSISPPRPKKKSSKGASLSGPPLPDGIKVNSETAWRASSNDPSSSQRGKPDPRDQSHTTGNHYGQSATEPPSISNCKAELKFCKDVLREVNKKVHEKFVWPFYEPVDIVKLGIPDYPKYVKRPMDLETMKNKLAHGQYPNGAAFADDFRLMLKNCYAFNPPSSAYYHCGKQLESLFESKWAERPPPEIPAPVPPRIVAAVEPPAYEVIQALQTKVAQLEERLNVETKSKARNNSVHAIPGTGPPKKQPYSRVPALSKSLANPSTSGPLIPEVVASSAPKIAKVNSTVPAKPKQTHGGARRKSLGSALAPTPKHPSHPFEQSVQDRQPGSPEQSLHTHQPPPLATAALASDPTPAPPAVSRRFAEPDYFEKIDYEQKKDLATQIQNAVEPMQSDAINLIRTSRPDLVPADGEEIELDIDTLDDRTLYQLYQLVCAPPPPPPTKGKKGPKGGATNGKLKGGARRKAGPGAPRKPSMTTVPPYLTTAAQPPGYTQEAEAPHACPPPVPQVVNGHSNGTKPNAIKKPRANAPGPKRKGIDETQEAARIKELEDKLHAFEGYIDPSPHHQNNQSNGVSSGNPTLGPSLNEPPPAGPVEYASSSSESESESDDDSD